MEKTHIHTLKAHISLQTSHLSQLLPSLGIDWRDMKAHFLLKIHHSVSLKHFSLDNTHSHSFNRSCLLSSTQTHTFKETHTNPKGTHLIERFPVLQGCLSLLWHGNPWQSMAAMQTPIYNWKPPVGMACLPHLKACAQSLKILTISWLCIWERAHCSLYITHFLYILEKSWNQNF